MFTHQIKTLRSAQELMKDNMLVKHYAGSISYGTNLPTSDVDFRGVFCGDPVNVRTPFFAVRECEDVDEEDTKLYELSHFMKLCLDCNPNIIETLWVNDTDITFRTPAYDLLREHRHGLLSSKVAFTTSGYAIAQLKRIRGHNKWINQPQSVEAPQPKDFVSMIQYFGKNKMLKFDIDVWNDNHRLIPYGNDMFGVYAEKGRKIFDRVGKLNTTYEGDRSEYESQSPVMIIKFNKDVYNEFKTKHEMYWAWKTNRNEKRSALEEAHGYDTKHAMHLVRLLRMGVEALRDEEIVVKRPDALELLEIRGGAWTYEEIVAYAEKMDKEVREVWYKKTKLPKHPDLKFAAALLMDVQDLVWYG
jgi:predicted nucleotidyltransferase